MTHRNWSGFARHSVFVPAPFCTARSSIDLAQYSVGGVGRARAPDMSRIAQRIVLRG